MLEIPRKEWRHSDCFDTEIITYFLYRGSLPDMSDKNMTMLQVIKKEGLSKTDYKN